ncbi:type IV pilus inner membrane component PilO [Dissulfurimicrobium hydrothermale]|uniref:type 4a pilus biogenesis protein PilO n=2 Tax=Dissulfurimicrobium TaxID=1769732 RepID=UPI001EDA03F9|nr:type 4a pilus biogenesis protein PilO [Dissulfurimicrobium hydrothermale]UKL13084.1 type 4a pilus biogenesis protein PilO [Dissulfurimicrobium hydrothermale]
MKTGKIKFEIPQRFLQFVLNLELWQKLVILAGSWVIPIAIFWFFIISGDLQELTRLSEDIPRLRDEVTRLEIQKAKIPQIEEELRSMQTLLSEALRLLPEKKDIPSVLTEISNLGNDARLEFNLFSPQTEVLERFYAVIPVKMEFTGSFFDIMGFFDKVSRMGRIVQMREISMDNPRQGRDVWSLKGQRHPAHPGDKADSAADNAWVETQGGGGWIVDVKCQAATFRFLSEDEQKAIAAAAKNKKNNGK